MGDMCGTCKTVDGLFILAAGAALAGFGMRSLAGDTAHLVAGGLFVLVGLGRLLHAGNMCPMCKKSRK